MKEKRKHWLLTALGQLTSWLLDVVEYVSHSNSWKRFIKMLFSLLTLVTKGGHHG